MRTSEKHLVEFGDITVDFDCSPNVLINCVHISQNICLIMIMLVLRARREPDISRGSLCWGGAIRFKVRKGCANVGARIAQLVNIWICDLWFAGSSRTSCAVLFWYGPLPSLSLQIASLASEHHEQNNGGRNQWIRVKILSRL